MVKLLIETGSESHTSSSASVQVKFANGTHKGKHLYEVKAFQVSAKWNSALNSKWVSTVYDLPEGTEIEIIGRGATGDRGAFKHAFHRIYRLEATAEVFDGAIPVGLRNATLKGRLVEVRNLIAEKKAAAKLAQETGF